jgi:uncharacterized membrane protein
MSFAREIRREVYRRINPAQEQTENSIGGFVVVLLILVLSCLIFRGLGFAGISVFSTWQASARDALSLMLVFTGVSHFTFMAKHFVRMMPPSIPSARGMVYFTGVCEIAGAVGLLLPEFRRAAAYALITFFLTVLPANIHAARAGVMLRGSVLQACGSASRCKPSSSR